jgi:TonB family protein
MILDWMLYAAAVALLLGIAALAIETGVRELGWPVRGLWGAALAGSVLLPLLAALRVLTGAGSGRLGGTLGAMSLLPGAGASGAAGSHGSRLGAFDPDPWLLALWATATLVLLAWLAMALWRIRRRSARWRPWWLDGRQVWLSEETGPAVVGVLRSRIVLPTWVLNRGAEERALILAHEEEHLLVRDPPLLAAFLLLVVAFPWNLPLWWQWRRFRQAVEFDCDRRVLARGMDPRAYGRLLLAVSEYGAPRQLSIAALAEPPSFLERRIRAMLLPRSRRGRLVATASAAVSALLLAGACNMDHPTVLVLPSDGAPEEAPDPAAFAYEPAVLDRKPELLNKSEVASMLSRLYPRMLHDAGIGGQTVVQLVITAEGTVDPSSVTVISSSREPFAEAARRVAEQLRFRPGTHDGKPVRVLLQMPITWQPDGEAGTRVVLNPQPAEDDAGRAGPTRSPRAEAAGDDFAYEVAVLERKPELRNKSQVASMLSRYYPRTLQNAGIGGQTVMQFVIEENGTVDPATVQVISTNREEFAEASTRVVEEFRFSPGVYQGRPVRTIIQMPITWQPQG